MKTETICPHCNKVNELAEDDGFCEGPREYHAECWSSVVDRLKGAISESRLRDTPQHVDLDGIALDDLVSAIYAATDDQKWDWEYVPGPVEDDDSESPAVTVFGWDDETEDDGHKWRLVVEVTR